MLKIFARTALAIIMATAAYSSTQDTNPVDDIMPVTERPACTFTRGVITLPGIPETNMVPRVITITGGGTLTLTDDALRDCLPLTFTRNGLPSTTIDPAQ